MASAYTPAQLSQYLSYIKLPAHLQTTPFPQPTLSFLHTLHTYQLCAVPYENLLLHYSQTHKISLDPQILFQKIVENRRGRGGYCMENAIFYNHVLRGLGFQVYLAAVRIRFRIGGVPQGDYFGMTHVVNIVTFPDGSKYHVDIAFGGDGATMPLPLVHDQPVSNSIGTQEVRLVRSHIPTQTLRTEDTKIWLYEYRNNKDQDWNSYYAFSEMEFLENDFKVLNWWTGSSPESFQTKMPIVVKFLRTEPGDGNTNSGAGHTESRIYGKLTMVHGEMKRNVGKGTEVLKVCTGEAERAHALQDIFGIKLTADERKGIEGSVSDLHRMTAEAAKSSG